MEIERIMEEEEKNGNGGFDISHSSVAYRYFENDVYNVRDELYPRILNEAKTFKND